jgi:hypothetical protein
MKYAGNGSLSCMCIERLLVAARQRRMRNECVPKLLEDESFLHDHQRNMTEANDVVSRRLLPIGQRNRDQNKKNDCSLPR